MGLYSTGAVTVSFAGRKNNIFIKEVSKEKIDNLIWNTANIVEIVATIVGIVIALWIPSGILHIAFMLGLLFLITRTFKYIADRRKR